MQHYTPHTLKIAITVIGYSNLSIVGKRNSLTVYSSKDQLIENESKAIEVKRNIYNKTKQFSKDLAMSIYGMALKAKVWTAKRMLRLKGYSWELYINVCNAFRLLRLFNNSVSFDLRVKL